VSAADTGRANQRKRTRKDLLDAAARLMRQGKRPSLEEVAEEALISRATAYRYFPSIEALLAESAIDLDIPSPTQIFDGVPAEDAAARLERVDGAFHDAVAANEAQMRIMLASAVQRAVTDPEAPVRQNRRSPLIEAALAPAKRQFKPRDLDMLEKALALVVGSEAMIVFKDVLGVDDAEARKVKRWAIRALVAAAKK
jgi:AcrR family transcriptional regulator